MKTEQKCEKITNPNVTCVDNPINCTNDCLNGFKLIDGNCICKIGMILPNGTCIWNGIPEESCLPGYVRKDGKCELDFECPPGKVNSLIWNYPFKAFDIF